MRAPRVRSRPMSENKTQYTIAVIPGDGIGKEVTPWAQQALEKAAGDAAQFTYVDFDLGAERYLRDGEILPDGVKVGSICLSPRGDWRMPSDATVSLWLKQLDKWVSK